MDEVLRRPDRGSSRGRRPHRRGELALPAGSADEHEQVAGDLLGQCGPVVRFRERERDVDAGGDAARGPDPALRDVDGVGWTSTSGCSRASAGPQRQWVAAARPSSRPAAASGNAPVQTETTVVPEVRRGAARR
ncbi:MAG TPA: hypothetical protein VIU87_13640 [Mycobacterium sp.]